MPTLTQLEYILAVARTGHFGKASESCHVSQPSLSIQIQKAEEELEIQIFDRNKKPVVPTQKGMVVVKQAQKTVGEYKKLLSLSRSETRELKGKFRLAVIPTLSPSVIPLFLREFSEKYPKVELFINELTTENIIRSLNMDEIDAGILATPLGEKNLEKRVLFFEAFSVYCSKNHPLLEKSFLKINDLKKHRDLWILSDGHCFKNQVLNFCNVNSTLEILKNVHFQSGSLETLKALVERVYGYTFLPQLNIDNLSVGEEKQVRHFKPLAPSREVSLVFLRSHWKKDIVQGLKKVIQNHLPPSVKKIRESGFRVIPVSDQGGHRNYNG